MKLPDLAGCSSYVGVMDPQMSSDTAVIQEGVTLSSPSGSCRVVMKNEPLMVDEQRQGADGEGTVSVPSPDGHRKVYLELQWFVSECAGLRDQDDIQAIDPRGEGHAGGGAHRHLRDPRALCGVPEPARTGQGAAAGRRPFRKAAHPVENAKAGWRGCV